MEAQKLRGSDRLTLAASWIFLKASGELPTNTFHEKSSLRTTEEKTCWGEVRPLTVVIVVVFIERISQT